MCLLIDCSPDILAVWRDLNVPHQHLPSWDSDFIKDHKSCIIGRITDFITKISQQYSWKGVKVFVSKLNHKYINSVLFSFDYKLGVYDSMGCSLSKSSRPPFNRLKSWGFENEFLGFFIVGSCGL